MQSCIKKDTLLTEQDEAIWYFWIENMKLKEKWIVHVSNKPGEITICYECSKMSSGLRWINPGSYEIVAETVVRNIYCNDCYSRWIKDESKNELDELDGAESKDELDEVESTSLN